MSAPPGRRAQLQTTIARAVVAASCLGHLLLGALLIPTAVFDKYPDAARLFKERRLGEVELADFSPLYLLLNVIFSPGPLRWLQLIGSSSLPLAAFLFGRRMFGDVRAAVAAVLTAFSVSLVVYSAALEPDIWIAVCAGWALVLFDNVRARPTLAHGVGASLVSGLAIALRPSNVLWVVAGLAVCVWPHRAVLKRLWRIGAVSVALLVVAAAAPLQYLRAVGGERGDVAATMSVGAVLHMGNRPESPGIGGNPPLLLKLYEQQLASSDRPDFAHALYRRFAAIDGGESGSEFRAELHWLRLAARFLQEEPAALAALWTRKAAFFLFGSDAHDLFQARQLDARLRPWPLIPTSLLFGLALVGLAQLALARRGGLIGAQLLCLLVTSLVFYVVARYRVPAIPAAALGVAAVWPAQQLRRRTLQLVATGVACVGVLAVIYAAPLLDNARRILLRAEESTAAGAALDKALAAGRLDLATTHFIDAQAAQPAIVWVRNLRGIPFERPAIAAASGARSVERFGIDTGADLYVASVLAARAGRCEEAVAGASAAQEAGFVWAVFDALQEPGLAAMGCLVMQGRLADGRDVVRKALSARPGASDALAALIGANTALGDQTSAETVEAFRQLNALHDHASVSYALARWYNLFGVSGKALESANELLRLLPDAAVGHYERAVAEAKLGHFKDAVLAYDRALLDFPRHPFATRPLDQAVTAAVEAEPESVQLLAIAAEHAYRRGDRQTASLLAQRAVQLSGGTVPVQYAARMRSYLR